MNPPTANSIADLRGYVATISLTGSVTPQYAACLMNMARYNDRMGISKVEYAINHGVLIESARDAVVQHALQPSPGEPPYDWVLQIDADATFPETLLHQLLDEAFIHRKDAGIVGTYAQLKGPPHVPTIDTGTGTWEEHYPGEGTIPVIRTGCHCFLAKTGVFLKIGPAPWFRTRVAQSPLRAMRELDGHARRLLDGHNPLRDHPEWATLLEAAREVSPIADSVVGEDSSFFDRCRAHGIPVYVATDIVTGHVSQKILMPDDFAKALRENRKMQQAALGVY